MHIAHIRKKKQFVGLALNSCIHECSISLTPWSIHENRLIRFKWTQNRIHSLKNELIRGKFNFISGIEKAIAFPLVQQCSCTTVCN